MNSFTDIYLQGLRSGMTKSAVINFKPFSNTGSATIGGAVGALGGGAVGALGNAAIGKKKTDPETGEESNGVLARLLKGGVIGGLIGGAGGAAVGLAGAKGIRDTTASAALRYQGNKDSDLDSLTNPDRAAALSALIERMTVGDLVGINSSESFIRKDNYDALVRSLSKRQQVQLKKLMSQ